MLKLAVVCAVIAAVSGHDADAVAVIVPGGNEHISGTLYFSVSHYGIHIKGSVSGLKPGPHGFHVHEKGDLGEKCVAAGPHFNPLKRTHGGPEDLERHAGDLGNIFADEYGVAYISIMDTHISLDPSSPAYIGNRAVVVHAGKDDLGRGGHETSSSTGNAGGRDGCGIINLIERPRYQSRPSNYRFRPYYYSK